ncbi:Hypothetical protein, putative [Bodo saltans]|uniref:Gamma-soluble NSF attachment protein n=1 Tax=Bodo saltans TaxID=75058 RepID=A0A0S4J9N7_BODSA|nr:Hypothetical protein, putative [Bodo saltans]|eukprot:CUG86941.1 Hypothetical protein, putative [Bodo saltans]
MTAMSSSDASIMAQQVVLHFHATRGALPIDAFDVCETIATMFPSCDATTRKAAYLEYVTISKDSVSRDKNVDAKVATPQIPEVPSSGTSVHTPTPPAVELTGFGAVAGEASVHGGDHPTLLHGAASNISFLVAGAAAGLIAKQTTDLAQGLMHSSLRLKSPLHEQDPRHNNNIHNFTTEATEGTHGVHESKTAPPILVLINDRCPSDMLPWLSAVALPIRPTIRSLSSGESPAWSVYEATEKSLSKGRSGSEWSDAVALFEQAGGLFDAAAVASSSSLTNVIMAGNCYVRAADCLRCLRDVDQMATFLERAGSAYSTAFPENRDDSAVPPLANGLSVVASATAEATVQAFTQAVFVSRAAGRTAKAARVARKGAEGCVRVLRFDDAVTLLYRACDLYDKELSMGAEARAVMTRAVGIAVVDMSNLSIAIDALEKLADVSIAEEQPLVLFRAMLCRLACLPGITGNDTNDAIIDCVYALDQYTDICVGLCGGKENTCLKQMIRGVEENDPVRVENAAEAYVSTHTALEEWIPPMMHMIWHRTVERLAHRTEHLRDVVAPK